MLHTLSNEPVLSIFNPDRPCILYTVASNIALGAKLAQVAADGHEQSVGYFSKALDEPQPHYSASEVECLAVILATKHFYAYLCQLFTLLTNHGALQWLLSLTAVPEELRLMLLQRMHDGYGQPGKHKTARLITPRGILHNVSTF